MLEILNISCQQNAAYSFLRLQEHAVDHNLIISFSHCISSCNLSVLLSLEIELYHVVLFVGCSDHKMLELGCMDLVNLQIW